MKAKVFLFLSLISVSYIVAICIAVFVGIPIYKIYSGWVFTIWCLECLFMLRPPYGCFLSFPVFIILTMILASFGKLGSWWAIGLLPFVSELISERVYYIIVAIFAPIIVWFNKED